MPRLKVQRAKYNSELSFSEFKLMEFSLDRDIFKADLNISVSHEDFGNELEFYAKYKANNLSDPKPVLSGGVVLEISDPPPIGLFENDPLDQVSFFQSLNENHCILKLDNQVDALKLARNVFAEIDTFRRVDKDELFEFLERRLKEGNIEWTTFYNANNRKNWRRTFKTHLMQKHQAAFGSDADDVKLFISSHHAKDFYRSLINLHGFEALLPAEIEMIMNVLISSKAKRQEAKEFIDSLVEQNIAPHLTKKFISLPHA